MGRGPSGGCCCPADPASAASRSPACSARWPCSRHPRQRHRPRTARWSPWRRRDAPATKALAWRELSPTASRSVVWRGSNNSSDAKSSEPLHPIYILYLLQLYILVHTCCRSMYANAHTGKYWHRSLLISGGTRAGSSFHCAPFQWKLSSQDPSRGPIRTIFGS